MRAPLRQRLAREMLVFFDGRAELYGEQFVLKYFPRAAARGRQSAARILRGYDIDAVLLMSGTPAVTFLDRLDSWQCI
jgi:hypothetical protein